MNSHIQLPNFVMKQFRERTGRVFYLDLETQEIGLCGTTVLGTKEGYFSDEIERFLNKNIENPLSRLRALIEPIERGDNVKIELPHEYEALLKRYIYTSIGRSEATLKHFKATCDYLAYFKEQDHHDNLVYTSLADPKIDFLRDHIFGIYINRISAGFAVPRNCFYTTGHKDIGTVYVVPFSPKIALALFPPSVINVYPDFIQHRGLNIGDAEIIKHMNIQALLYEYVINGKFVIAQDKAQLQELLIYMNSHIDEFEAEKAKFTKKERS